MIRINCDLCGKVDERLNRVIVESVEMSICPSCSKYGKVLGPLKKPIQKITRKNIEDKEEKIQLLVDNYGSIIKKRRESMGLTQKDFARKINEKESTVHKIEKGALEPQLSLAKKLEKILGIKLIEEYKETHESFKKNKEDGFTLGDFIKIRR